MATCDPRHVPVLLRPEPGELGRAGATDRACPENVDLLSMAPDFFGGCANPSVKRTQYRKLMASLEARIIRLRSEAGE